MRGSGSCATPLSVLSRAARMIPAAHEPRATIASTRTSSQRHVRGFSSATAIATATPCPVCYHLAVDIRASDRLLERQRASTFSPPPFIRDRELPRILKRRQQAHLTVLPIVLSPSTVRSDSIAIDTADGAARHIVLSEFHGFGTPDQTLNEMSLNESQRRFVARHDRPLRRGRSSWGLAHTAETVSWVRRCL